VPWSIHPANSSPSPRPTLRTHNGISVLGQPHARILVGCYLSYSDGALGAELLEAYGHVRGVLLLLRCAFKAPFLLRPVVAGLALSQDGGEEGVVPRLARRHRAARDVAAQTRPNPHVRIEDGVPVLSDA